MTELQRRILQLIQKQPGKLSWYQLDRRISAEGVQTRGLMNVIHELERIGLISTGEGPSPGLPVYAITSSGEEALQETPGSE